MRKCNLIRMAENEKRYYKNKLLINRKPKKEENGIDNALLQNQINLSKLSVLKTLSIAKLNKLSLATEIPLSIIISFKNGVYTGEEKLQKILLYGLKKMGLYENTKY